jgi:hypothetical protein
LLKTHKNKTKNKFIVSERQYIGITATINGFRSTLASCEVVVLGVVGSYRTIPTVENLRGGIFGSRPNPYIRIPVKTLLGFDFDGKQKTMWLEKEKRAKLLTILHSWLRAGSLNRGIPFGEFQSVIAKVRHAFTALPGGRGLLSLCNRLLKRRPPVVYFHRNASLHAAISNCRTILRKSTSRPTWGAGFALRY